MKPIQDTAAAFRDIDDYISAHVPDRRPALIEIRNLIHECIPDAHEVISYQMPAFKFNGAVIYFASFKNHFSVFVRPKYLDVFRSKFWEYKLSRSAIQFPADKPLPHALLTDLVQYIANENMAEVKK
jgi:uncharacterized protein YdhG (YjbR/CyaY superfamily)